MLKPSRSLSFIAAFCLLVIVWGPVSAQVSDEKYFPETGHYVKGDFLRYYQSASNPTVTFGYPLTEQFTSKDGKTVQYFQRARFEQSVGTVVLTALGRETYIPGRQLTFNNPLACREFVSGYSVCFAFLDFFDQNGGLEKFGNPITPFEFHNNLIVQYFENARFEWRPNQPEGQRVGLTDLGRVYFDQLREDQGFIRPLPPPDSAPRPVLSLQVRAFPAKAVTTASDEQTIYVLVQDQNLHPVQGANGTATIILPSGNMTQKAFVTTNNGVGVIKIDFKNQPSGKLVNIDISVSNNGLERKTATSFRIWY